ncbi:transposase [Streptomyces sp. TRM75563]|nr:transposase [Streptomyces sp. TRM75563]
MWTRRQLIDGIRRRTRAGTPWRDIPERYGQWDRIWDLFRRWQREPPGGIDSEPDDHGLGPSRGGLTSKIHLPPDTTSRPCATRRQCWSRP